MKPKTASHHRRWVLRVFEWALLVSVVMLLMGVLLQKVEQLQAEAERLSFEGVVNSLKAAVMLDSFVNNPTEAISEGDNPMQLMDQLPSNYLGILDASDPAVQADGQWYFDKVQRLLIYRTQKYRRANSAFGDDRSRQFYLRGLPPKKQLILEVVKNNN
ncbi:MAG: hypothetical protein BA870_03045 [Desulfuromonadales bacterium C00003094]|jgi:hypothetical protein|nr:MAG: hypothetical protein BA870_03045 [Desulfuromonadales bacterium C00003094]OEU72264.1 MAG: hypothetical protein BA869_04555 [Desulfuromonadales bacterium C00003107]